jgi:hypothetical protein
VELQVVVRRRRADSRHRREQHGDLYGDLQAALSRRVEKVVGYPPLSEMGDAQRREFHEALLDAGSFEDLPGKWQAAIVTAEQNRPKLRVVGSD